MAFRLTVLLIAGLFLAMYFAPAAPPPEPRAQDSASDSAPAAAPAQPTPPATAQQSAPADTSEDLPPVVALPKATETRPAPTGSAPAPTDPLPPPADAGPEQAQADPDSDEPVSIPGLSIGGGSDAADALSLSDAARERAAEAARDATDTLLRDLVGSTPAAEPSPDTQSGPAPTDPNPAPAPQRAMVTGTSVNLRAGPSTSNAVVGRVDFGQVLSLTGPFENGWAGVINPTTGQEAYMASRFLQIQP